MRARVVWFCGLYGAALAGSLLGWLLRTELPEAIALAFTCGAVFGLAVGSMRWGR